MKLFSNQHKFSYPWEAVSAANWLKYPNEITPHVVHVDYLSRWVDPATGNLHTERLLTCQQNIPSLVSKLVGGANTSMVYEASEVDVRNRKLTLRSRNLSFGNLMTIEEVCTYSPINEASTLFNQEARVTSLGGWNFLQASVEEFCVSRFQSNAHKGRMALESALERLYSDAKEQVLEFLDPISDTASTFSS